MSKRNAIRYNREIGERLEHIRNILGMSQQVVADQLGVTRQTLSNYESGRNSMSAGIVRAGLATVLEWFMLQSPYSACIEFEPKGCQHGDLEYLYVVEGIVDHRWGKTKDGKLPITISVYGIGWDEDYADAEKREPIFSGTAYEYIEKFGKEQ